MVDAPKADGAAVRTWSSILERNILCGGRTKQRAQRELWLRLGWSVSWVDGYLSLGSRSNSWGTTNSLLKFAFVLFQLWSYYGNLATVCSNERATKSCWCRCYGRIFVCGWRIVRHRVSQLGRIVSFKLTIKSARSHQFRLISQLWSRTRPVGVNSSYEIKKTGRGCRCC